MARYVDVDNLIAEYDRVHIGEPGGARKLMVDAPTADVQEVKRAKWIISSDGYYPYCSHCKTEPENGVMTKYCPECGAMMRGAE